MQNDELSSLITFHRKRAQLTQAALATHAGVSRNVVQDLEAGKNRTSWKNLQAVLSVLNLTLDPKGPLVETWRQQEQQQEDGGKS